MLENCDKLIKTNWRLIMANSSYYNLSYEEIVQECRIVYFCNPEIDEVIEEDLFKAFGIFLKHYRNSIKSFGNFNNIISSRERSLKEKERLDLVKYTYSDIVFSPEDNYVDSHLISELRKVLDDEEYTFAVNYHSFGDRQFARELGRPRGIVRGIYKRIINKARLRLGV